MTDLPEYTTPITIDALNTLLDWQPLPALAKWVLDQALAMQCIPAPTFDEARRADYVAAQFRRLGLENVHIDGLYNVYGLRRGQGATQPGTMVSAHLDTVFPHDVDLTTRKDGDVIYGPGLGDNSLGTAGMLGMAYWLKQQALTVEHDIWFVATSREEGLGDLGGMRRAYDALKDKVQQVINLEGMALGHVYHAGIAVRRLHITAQTEGGHSWAHYGRASAIHHIMQLGAKIAAITPPSRPRTTYNIGVIEGGQSINTIAARAGLWLDMRSEESYALNSIEKQVRRMVNEQQNGECEFTVAVVGDRPAGSIAVDHPLVTCALDALKAVEHDGTLATGSTDGNVSLAVGCPTITLGVSTGGNAHRLDEYIDVPPIIAGMQQLLLVLLASTGLVR